MNDRLKKTERLLKIWLLLLNNPSGYTARELARRFGVNERTIYRDFTTLGLDLTVPVVRRQGKWDTFKTEVNGHLEACSNNGKPVDYGLKEGVSHGTADYRPLLAG